MISGAMLEDLGIDRQQYWADKGLRELDTERVYLVKLAADGGVFHPQPFRSRDGAHRWAAKRGYLPGEYTVEGFRVRD